MIMLVQLSLDVRPFAIISEEYGQGTAYMMLLGVVFGATQWVGSGLTAYLYSVGNPSLIESCVRLLMGINSKAKKPRQTSFHAWKCGKREIVCCMITLLQISLWVTTLHTTNNDQCRGLRYRVNHRLRSSHCQMGEK